MKKNILIVVTALCLSVVAAQAQNPSQQPPPRDTTSVDHSQSYLKDMKTIRSNDIPAALRTTLQAPEYKGWENGTIYRNEDNNMYLIEMRDENQQVTPYRFNADGKPIKDNDN